MKIMVVVVGVICCCLISGCGGDDDVRETSILDGGDKNLALCGLIHGRKTVVNDCNGNKLWLLTNHRFRPVVICQQLN